jgi:hypothetical protein
MADSGWVRAQTRTLTHRLFLQDLQRASLHDLLE